MLNPRIAVLAVPLLVGAFVLGAYALVEAQQHAPPLVLHEDLRAPEAQSERSADRLASGVPILGPKPRAMQNPTALASQDKLLAAPDTSAERSKGEQILGSKDFGVDRKTESKPDYRTAADDQLQYTEVFNPAIVPFKRMSVLDSVRSDYTLFAKASALGDLPIRGQAPPDHDLFWASILVDLKPGADVPIPSVSPGMSIVSYESEPALALSFSKDVADNFFVRTDEIGAAGTYRIVFSAAASPYYFSPRRPAKLRIRDIPAGSATRLPENVQSVADSVLTKMRLHPGMFVGEALNKLVYYFRSFDAKSPPQNTGDVYLDLVNSQAGVCRHRSFAFMVTANALGIPTRYVSNEAHAWVEVWLPESNWMRIDLGGAASTLNVDNASDKSMYRPRLEDPFQQPESYSDNYTQLSGDVRGLRDEQIEERQNRYTESEAGQHGNGSFFGDNEDSSAPLSNAVQTPGPLTGPGSSLPAVPDEELAGKAPSYISLFSASSDGYLGETIDVRGVVYDQARKGLTGLRINIFLAPAGNEGNDAVLVGVGIADEEGGFQSSVELPTSLAPTAYEVFASTPGNEEFQPSVSN